MKIAGPQDYRELARRRLPRFLFEYIDGGSYAEQTLRSNVADLARVRLRQRVLNDVSEQSLSTTLLGRSWSMPVALGPIGLAGLNARRGEVQAARAAQAMGVPYCLSTVSACSLAEVTRSVPEPIWFQLYVMRDRGFLRELLARATASRCSALVMTVDMPLPGARYRDVRSGLAGAAGLPGKLRRIGQALRHPRWAWDVGIRGRPLTLGNVATVLDGRTGLEDFFAWMRANFDPSVSWSDLEWIRSQWSGPLVIKGILEVEDARRVASLGADALVVSNHGGRQLDGVQSTAMALPAIAAAVGERLTVLVDGGVRSGLDVVRMLGLGARGVLLGRAWAYALAGAGQSGVHRLLTLMADEMRIALALTGRRSIGEIDASILQLD